jgi:hypothetical protein
MGRKPQSTMGCMGMMGRKNMGPMMGSCCGPQSGRRTEEAQSSKTGELAKYSTQELRTLFEDWLLQLEEELRPFAEQCENLTPEAVAEAFHISLKSAEFLLNRLAKK